MSMNGYQNQKPRTPILENDIEAVIDHIDDTPGNAHLQDHLLRSHRQAMEAEYEAIAKFIQSNLNVRQAFVESFTSDELPRDHDLGILIETGDVSYEDVADFISNNGLPLTELNREHNKISFY